jgi:hypothetical protein
MSDALTHGLRVDAGREQLRRVGVLQIVKPVRGSLGSLVRRRKLADTDHAASGWPIGSDSTMP